MGNTEDQDEDESTQTQSFGADDAPPDDDDAPSSQGTAWGRLIPVPGPGFRGSGPVEITGDSATTKNSIKIPAVAPDSRPRAPFTEMLIVDWPIIASPPMAPNNPETAFATPCATHS